MKYVEFDVVVSQRTATRNVQGFDTHVQIPIVLINKSFVDDVFVSLSLQQNLERERTSQNVRIYNIKKDVKFVDLCGKDR